MLSAEHCVVKTTACTRTSADKHLEHVIRFCESEDGAVRVTTVIEGSRIDTSGRRVLSHAAGWEIGLLNRFGWAQEENLCQVRFVPVCARPLNES